MLGPGLHFNQRLVTPFRGRPATHARHRSLARRRRPAAAGATASAAEPDPLTPGTNQEDLLSRLEEMTKKLNTAERALQDAADSQRALAPFRVSAPKRGIVGSSRYAQKLRHQIVDASHDSTRRPVIVFGEPGLQKKNIAALIHFGAPTFNAAPCVSVDCDRLDEHASELFGRGAKKGLLSWVPPQGTIILNNVHKAPPEALPLLVREVATASLAASMDEGDEGTASDGEGGAEGAGRQKCRRSLLHPRLLMTAEARVAALEVHATVIKVPPLRVRPKDVPALTRFFLRQQARRRGLGDLQLTTEAVMRLETGTFPNNVTELQGDVERAVAFATQSQTASAMRQGLPTSDSSLDDPGSGSSPQRPPRAAVIGEEVFWFASADKDRLRINLLRTMPWLKTFLRSEVWPKRINFEFTMYAFAVVVALLFLGPQDREHNFALNAFWDYWWALSFVAFPFLGRIWCSVCPFMIYGELVQQWRRATGAHLLKWPRETVEAFGPWFLFSLFAAILVWEEVWDLPQHAALSSWLLLLITAGAMAGSFFFERRIWCRHLCPIGGMNGLMAKLSMTELRAKQGVCSAQCTSYSCYKGGPAVPPEGQETLGCPLYSHPAQLTDNRDCVLCMECLKACPHSSVEFRLRVPGGDLWNGTHTPSVPESWLMFMLLGAVYLHHLPHLLVDLGIEPETIVTHNGPHILASALVLAAPGLLAWGVDAAWQVLAAATQPASAAALQPAMASQAGQEDPAAQAAVGLLQRAASGYAATSSGAAIVAPYKPFLDRSYAFLPLVWGGTLAHYIKMLLAEGGHILPVAAATFGLNAPWLPAGEVDPAVVGFLQGSILLGSLGISLALTRKIGAQPWKALLPQCAVTLALTAGLWHVIYD